MGILPRAILNQRFAKVRKKNSSSMNSSRANPKQGPYSLVDTISVIFDEALDPKPDPKWKDNAQLPTLSENEESVRVLGLQTTPHTISIPQKDADAEGDDISLIDKCRENISYFVDEALDPKPDPEHYRGSGDGGGDDDSLIERVSFIMDQTLFPPENKNAVDDDDNHSLISQAAMMVDGIVEEVLDPKPDENYHDPMAAYGCSCLG